MAMPPAPNNTMAGNDQSRSPRRRRRPSPSLVHHHERTGQCDQSATPAQIVSEVSKQFSTAHEDKLHQLVGDDEGDAES
jgi:hypothetical protein